MSCGGETISKIGIQFFGKISASISHEIKNCLAIINENAGLLDDYTVMAEKGVPIDPGKIKNLAGKITLQIQRANEIIKNMNRFSHSSDEFVKKTDIGELTELVTAISRRFAAMRNITLEFRNPEKQIQITTNPFFLESLLFLCLNEAMDAVGDTKKISLIAEQNENGASVRFTRLAKIGESLKEKFSGEDEKILISLVKAEITSNIAGDEIILNLPKNINNKGN